MIIGPYGGRVLLGLYDTVLLLLTRIALYTTNCMSLAVIHEHVFMTVGTIDDR